MAENQGVWGIEIGQAGLKAIRLRYAEAAGQVLAVAFDYVPHPKILSQPDAIPEELIPQALETFLSRNEVHGDLLAIGVPGHSALARFIQLPPVEASKVAEIVKYEARQQIPFALEDVIWDFQPLGGGVEESGFMLDAEVGLFAMKREQVAQALRPFLDAKLEVELVQIAPLGLHNFLCYDRLGQRSSEEFEPPEEYTLILDMGTDNTTLLVTNGRKIWIRNVPLGGNHFTRALTKEMKLTFAKAEHLKCNATKSPDPRAVFQALRPVFNDYVSEIQRSIGYFSSVNRDAKIGRVVGAGNGFKLAGLQKFLQQNLQYEVERVDGFRSLAGDNVLNAPLFQENILSFVVPYGLALQVLNLTTIRTTLLPSEIAVARKIRRKKPWAVVTAATLLVGLATSTFGYATVKSSVSTDRFGETETKVDSFKSQVTSLQTQYSQAESENQALAEEGDQLVGNLDGRLYWLELYRAINECLPRDVADQKDEPDIRKRHGMSLLSVKAKRYGELSEWFEPFQQQPQLMDDLRPQDHDNPPSGPGYVFTVEGVHYHREKDPNPQYGGATLYKRVYVKETFLKNLGKWVVQQPDSPQPVPVRKLGITHAIIPNTISTQIDYYPKGKKSTVTQSGGPRGFGRMQPSYGRPVASPRAARTDAKKDAENEPEMILIDKTVFTVQFAWRQTPRRERSNQEPAAPTAAPPETAAAPAATSDTPPVGVVPGTTAQPE